MLIPSSEKHPQIDFLQLQKTIIVMVAYLRKNITGGYCYGFQTLQKPGHQTYGVLFMVLYFWKKNNMNMSYKRRKTPLKG